MSKKTKEDEGPTCACGKADLYEGWVKLNENKKEEVSASAKSDQVDDHNNLDNDSSKEGQKQIKTEK